MEHKGHVPTGYLLERIDALEARMAGDNELDWQEKVHFDGLVQQYPEYSGKRDRRTLVALLLHALQVERGRNAHQRESLHASMEHHKTAVTLDVENRRLAADVQHYRSEYERIHRAHHEAQAAVAFYEHNIMDGRRFLNELDVIAGDQHLADDGLRRALRAENLKARGIFKKYERKQ